MEVNTESSKKVIIHPTAIVHPKAEIDYGVEIGPYSIVEAHVKIGAGTKVGARVTIEGHTTLGRNNQIFTGAIVGSMTQDKKYKGGISYLKIGDNNSIREYCTLNPGTLDGTETVIGNGNLLMAYAHVAHDCIVRNDTVIANNGTLAGHCVVEDKAIIGGLSGVHQFVRIGKLSIVGYGEAEVRGALENLDGRIKFSRQKDQRGTGHAVTVAKEALKHNSGDVLVLAGDAPLLKKETLLKLIAEHERTGSQVSILSAHVENPGTYGRIIRNFRGEVIAIREELDASDKERELQEINSGTYLFSRQHLFNALEKIKAANKKKEYYLTDTIEILIHQGQKVSAFCLADEGEVMGINTRKDLVKANLMLYQRKISELLESGVTVLSPENTFIASDVSVGEDTIIFPFTYIERGVKIGKGCRIGPFAYLREGSQIDDKAQIGSFVEVVRSRVGKRTMIKHLSYVGDTIVGDQVNIGAGTITANYDGSKKFKTVIEDGAFIGSNTVLIAPVKVGKKAKTGAGSVVLASCNVPKGTTVAGVPAKNIKSIKRSKQN